MMGVALLVSGPAAAANDGLVWMVLQANKEDTGGDSRRCSGEGVPSEPAFRSCADGCDRRSSWDSRSHPNQGLVCRDLAMDSSSNAPVGQAALSLPNLAYYPKNETTIFAKFAGIKGTL